MDLRICSIVIDSFEFDKMSQFWQEALGYVPREHSSGGWIMFRDPRGKNPNISLNQVPERHTGGNWLHFDLYAENREREMDRLLKIGATLHPESYVLDDDFRVLEDPDSNLFCVSRSNSGASRLCSSFQSAYFESFHQRIRRGK